jgi:predicted ribosome quality control (RQC) complex YloA/Tae2 family protein
MRADEALAGARLRRIAEPFHDLVALELSARDLHGTLLLGVSAAARGIGWVERRLSAPPPRPWLQRVRSQIEGGRLQSIAIVGSCVRLSIDRGEERFVFEARLWGRDGNATLRGAGGEVLVALHERGSRTAEADSALEQREQSDAVSPELATLRERGERLLQDAAGASRSGRLERIDRMLQRALQRAQRKLLAIEGDLRRAEDVAELRRNASLLLAHLTQLRGGAEHVTVLDHYADPPRPIELRIAPALNAKEQAEAWFQRARKLERGAAIAAERARTSRTSIASLEALRARARATTTDAELEATEAELIASGVASSASLPTAAGTPRPVRLPYRQFQGHGARSILVGRSAKDNDRLTLDHSRPHDLWMHARDDSGSHVVIPLDRDETCPPELLVDGATLAAHFSAARGEERVEVLYTARRYVRKARKSAPGQVSLIREKVLQLRLEPERLRGLLEAERPAGGSPLKR